jgi:hypothetical protein
MLHVLPAEVTLIVLSYLPIPSLLSLAVLSRQWVHFFAAQQSEIFRRAAIYHEYIPPGTMSLEGALSMKTGKPWAGSASWKDFCESLPRRFHRLSFHSSYKRRFLVTRVVKGYRSFHFYKNWEGKGRAVARVLLPPGSNPHHIKVDEKTGICITTRLWGGIVVTHLFSGTILWCLPLVRDFLLLKPPLVVPMCAQAVACSPRSAPAPAASTKTGISSSITMTGSRKFGACPATLPPTARLLPLLGRMMSRWPRPPMLRPCTVITHRVGISGLGRCYDLPSPCSRTDLHSRRSYAQTWTMLSYMTCGRVPSCRRSTSIFGLFTALT